MRTDLDSRVLGIAFRTTYRRSVRLRRRREFCHSAALPSAFGRCFERDGEGVSSKWQNSRRRLVRLEENPRAHSPLQHGYLALGIRARLAPVLDLRPSHPRSDRAVRACAVGESSVILLHPPLPLVGASREMERERQQNDGTLANG